MRLRTACLLLMALVALTTPACVRGIKLPSGALSKGPRVTMPPPGIPRGVPPGGGAAGVGRQLGGAAVGGNVGGLRGQLGGVPPPAAFPRPPVTPGHRVPILVPTPRPGLPLSPRHVPADSAGHADDALAAARLSPADLRRFSQSPGNLGLDREHALLLRGYLIEASEHPTPLKLLALPEAAAEKFGPEVRTAYRAVLGLDHAGGELVRPWGARPPDVPSLHLSLRDIHAGSPKLAEKVRVGLVVKATQEGRPDLARRLRDLSMAADEVALPARRPVLPVPEGPAGAQPGQRDSVRKGLADLGEDAAAEADRLHADLGRQMSRAGDFHHTMSHSAYHLVRMGQRLADNEDKDERKRRLERRPAALAGVARHLGRPLRPSERLLVGHMAGLSDEAIANTLKALD